MGKNNVVVVVVAVLAGLLVGALAMYWLRGDAPSAGSNEPKILYYRNPMGSGHTSDKPMKDEMGMDYIPVYEKEQGAGASSQEPGLVTINPTVVQNIGVRTAPVTKGAIKAQIVANGVLALDESRTTTVTAKVDGYVEKLHVTSVGQVVKEGDPLFEMYSPDLVALLEEYLAALRYQESLPATASQTLHRNATDLVVSAHKRIQLIGLIRPQIAKIQSDRGVPRAITFFATHNGVILKKNVLEGGYVSAGTELFTLADLSEVWVLADVYALDFGALRPGQRASVTVQGIPGRTFNGRVDFIYPTMESQSRTVKVRIALPNPQRVLRPDMFASVAIQTGNNAQSLLVPKSAVLRTGKRDLVILALGEGRFRPQQVQLGAETPDHYAVQAGVKEGDIVVTSAQFLIDSESRIGEAVQKLNDAPANDPPPAEPMPPAALPSPRTQPPATTRQPARKSAPAADETPAPGASSTPEPAPAPKSEAGTAPDSSAPADAHAH